MERKGPWRGCAGWDGNRWHWVCCPLYDGPCCFWAFTRPAGGPVRSPAWLAGARSLARFAVLRDCLRHHCGHLTQEDAVKGGNGANVG